LERSEKIHEVGACTVEEVVSRGTHCVPYSHRGRAMDQVEGILEHRCVDGEIQENGNG
jgi:hypothetical protein